MLKLKYPGSDEAERERLLRSLAEPEEPEFIAGAPNYDAFEGWSPEEVLIWLNID